MNVLVFNSGSSSLKYRLVDSTNGKDLCKGRLERLGEEHSHARHQWLSGTGVRREQGEDYDSLDHSAALQHIYQHLETLAEQENLPSPEAIGHRVVHGGDRFRRAVAIDQNVITEIEQLAPLAPLHNPPALAVINQCREHFPQLPQAAVFDTAFHQRMPAHARRYAVPDHWYRDHRVQRYGFHGISHGYAARAAAQQLGRPLEQLKLITLHLGNGASAAAIKNGHSVDTSMGMTPLEGLVMGTRSGDVDIAAALHVAREEGLDLGQLEQELRQCSGLLGLCGSNDVRDISSRSDQGDAAAKLALAIYAYRIRKYIGAYIAVLGGLDALVFTAGVGENSAAVRAMACTDMQNLGISIDKARNRCPGLDGSKAIHTPGAPVTILIVRANEELEIARQTMALLNAR
ncbi:acetate kinase [Kineobactrum sediminis]|uniref:Acetate kinase n=1 Tax=Kineobactrum sediminis TaxID=1905677 RepID=A0A2N5Y7B8_9GAMM|nr:acetate kinase [Kineobactrum sediminis]PLW84293.1 acetate kinase [Kineobactrum sediminis]